MPTREDSSTPSATLERVQLAQAAAAIAGDREVVDVAALAGDARDTSALVAALRDRIGPGATVLCAGVLERLGAFLAVVEALVAIAAEREATVILAVPNHAYTDADTDASAWGEGAVSELRGLLPTEHVVWHQVALRGSALVPAAEEAVLAAGIEVDARRAVPVGFVLAFGPNASRLRPELARQRALTAELEILRARLSERDAHLAIAAPVDEQAVESPE
jgi:hypothetical protein